MTVRGGWLVAGRRGSVGAVLAIAVALLVLALGTVGAATAAGETYLREDFTTETGAGDMFGPLLSEIPEPGTEPCHAHELITKEQCHWTRTQGADVPGQAFPVVFATGSAVQTDEEGKSSPYADQAYKGAFAPGNFWHIQKGPQTLEILPYVRDELIELGESESASLPAAPPEDTEPLKYKEGAEKLKEWAPRYAWFGEGNISGEASNPEGATGTYCGEKQAEIEATRTAELERRKKEEKELLENKRMTLEPIYLGCTSKGTLEGELVSPPFSLETAPSAYLHFDTWWEIEAESPTQRDLLAVDYSTNNGTTWHEAALLNPGRNGIGPKPESQPFSNMGLQRAPQWTEDVVDLQPAIHSKEVEVRFRFDARDELHNGYRGWAIDNVDVNSTPRAAPTITSCSIGASRSPVVEGTGFLVGSEVIIDGYEKENALAQSYNRVEVPPKNNFGLAPQTLQVIDPESEATRMSSNVVSFANGACTQYVPPAGGGSGSGGAGTGGSGGSSTSHPTKHAIERGRPAVDLRNGEIAAEFEFPEPGKADYTAVVGQGASLARVASGAMASLAAPLAVLADLGGVRATAAASKKCKKNYVRKNGKCVDNAPVGYGHASTTITKAGRYRVVITPAGPVRKALKKGKTLHVRLTLTFIPAGTDLHLITATTVTVHLKTKH